MQNWNTELQYLCRNKLHRPSNPRQYRRKKSPSRYRIDPAQKRICTTMPPIEQTRADRNRAYDPTLLYVPMAPPEEISVQIKIESESSWDLEAVDSADVDPCIIEVKQESDLGREQTFEWVMIKQQKLDSQEIAPNNTADLPAIKQELKTKSLEPPIQIKQEELDLEETGPHEQVSEPLKSILGDDGNDVEEYEIKQEIISLGGIGPISVDDVDAEPPSIGESTADNCPSMIKHEPLEILDYEGVYPEPSLINSTGTQKAPKAIVIDEHTCVPRRIYPYRFLKNTCPMGYSIQAVRLLNGNKKRLTNVFHCNNCNQRYTNIDLIKEHVLTHNVVSKRYPQFYRTNDCKICIQQRIDLENLIEKARANET